MTDSTDELRLGKWRLPNLRGELTLNRDQEGRWELTLCLTAGPIVISADDDEDDDRDDTPLFPRVEIGCVLADDDWHLVEGRTLHLDGDDLVVGWIQLWEYESVWDVKLTFGHAEKGAIRVAMVARACEDWGVEPYLDLSFDALCALAGDAAPRPPDSSADCPLGRKSCRSCGTVSFDVTTRCPTCGAERWWHE